MGEKNSWNLAAKVHSTSVSLKIKDLAVYIVVARESRLTVHCNTLISAVSFFRVLTFDLHCIPSWVTKHLNCHS